MSSLSTLLFTHYKRVQSAETASQSVAARGCLPPGANVFVAAPPPQSDLQLIVLWLQRWH